MAVVPGCLGSGCCLPTLVSKHFSSWYMHCRPILTVQEDVYKYVVAGPCEGSHSDLCKNCLVVAQRTQVVEQSSPEKMLLFYCS